MKKILLAFFLPGSIFLYAQTTTKDYTIQLNVSVQQTPPSLTFQWAQDTSSNNYSVSRKLKDATSWTLIASGLPDTTTQFTDLNLSIGDAYEYRFVRNYSNYSATTYTY